MLIRSQNRKILVNAACVCIADQNKFYAFISGEQDGTPIGQYDSGIRCIEILDEIQREFQYSNHYSGSGINSQDCQSWSYGVYLMPEK